MNRRFTIVLDSNNILNIIYWCHCNQYLNCKTDNLQNLEHYYWFK